MSPKSDSLQAVIFDIDGTLLDSVDLHAKAWVDAFSDFGHQVGFVDVRRQIGKGGDQLMPAFLSREEIESRGEALEAHRGDILQQRYLPLMRPFPQVRELMERIRSEGVTIALASSAKGDEVQKYKRLLGVTDLVDVETSSDDADKSKPHPDIFQALLRRLEDHDPRTVLAVGDTPYDAQAAAQAGIDIVGVLCGGWSEADLRDAGCFAVFTDPADLLRRYHRWITR